MKFVVTNTLIVRAVQRSVAFYRDVLGATVLHEGEPTFLRLGNIWLTINIGGGPTDDKPEVVASMPSADDQSHVDSLRNETMVRAIAQQAEAERLRRAKVINAIGEQQAAEKLVEAGRLLAQEPQAMQLRYFAALHDIAGERSSTREFNP